MHHEESCLCTWMPDGHTTFRKIILCENLFIYCIVLSDIVIKNVTISVWIALFVLQMLYVHLIKASIMSTGQISARKQDVLGALKTEHIQMVSCHPVPGCAHLFS